MEDSKNRENYDAPTLLLKDSSNDELFCYLEQIVKVEGTEYALLTPCLLYTSPSPRDSV